MSIVTRHGLKSDVKKSGSYTNEEITNSPCAAW